MVVVAPEATLKTTCVAQGIKGVLDAVGVFVGVLEGVLVGTGAGMVGLLLLTLQDRRLMKTPSPANNTKKIIFFLTRKPLKGIGKSFRDFIIPFNLDGTLRLEFFCSPKKSRIIGAHEKNHAPGFNHFSYFSMFRSGPMRSP
jgi:hypothetical protein